MFQNKKLKRNATYAIAEVAEVALCASNCALPTSGKYPYETNKKTRKIKSIRRDYVRIF